MPIIKFTLNPFRRSNVFTTSDADGGMAALTEESLQNLIRIAPNISGSIRRLVGSRLVSLLCH